MSGFLRSIVQNVADSAGSAAIETRRLTPRDQRIPTRTGQPQGPSTTQDRQQPRDRQQPPTTQGSNFDVIDPKVSRSQSPRNPAPRRRPANPVVPPRARSLRGLSGNQSVSDLDLSVRHSNSYQSLKRSSVARSRRWCSQWTSRSPVDPAVGRWFFHSFAGHPSVSPVTGILSCQSGKLLVKYSFR